MGSPLYVIQNSKYFYQYFMMIIHCEMSDWLKLAFLSLYWASFFFSGFIEIKLMYSTVKVSGVQCNELN